MIKFPNKKATGLNAKIDKQNKEIKDFEERIDSLRALEDLEIDEDCIRKVTIKSLYALLYKARSSRAELVRKIGKK